MHRWILIFAVALSQSPSWATSREPVQERSYVLMFALRDTPRVRADRAAVEKQMLLFARHYLNAYKIIQPELRRIVKIGRGQYNMIYGSRFDAQRAMGVLPRACGVLLEGADYEVQVSPNFASYADESAS